MKRIDLAKKIVFVTPQRLGHSHQLRGLHEELVELVRVALVEEGLGSVLVQNGDRVVDLQEQRQEVKFQIKC